MTAHLTPAQILKTCARAELLHEVADDADALVVAALRPAINEWHKVESVPCGFTGGWEFKAVEGANIALEHSCFYAHRYDLENVYSTTAPIAALVDLLPTTGA